MASQTMLINGAASQGITPITEALSALMTADIIGLVYCWPIALIHMTLSPL